MPPAGKPGGTRALERGQEPGLSILEVVVNLLRARDHHVQALEPILTFDVRQLGLDTQVKSVVASQPFLLELNFNPLASPGEVALLKGKLFFILEHDPDVLNDLEEARTQVLVVVRRHFGGAAILAEDRHLAGKSAELEIDLKRGQPCRGRQSAERVWMPFSTVSFKIRSASPGT